MIKARARSWISSKSEYLAAEPHSNGERRNHDSKISVFSRSSAR